jgi:hypothetical protein
MHVYVIVYVCVCVCMCTKAGAEQLDIRQEHAGHNRCGMSLCLCVCSRLASGAPASLLPAHLTPCLQVS